MGQADVQRALLKLAKLLDDAAIPYAIAGAMALNEYGYQRVTAGVDVLLTREGLAKLKLRALGRGQLHHLARLYWYTVEFGLLDAAEGLRIYGAGIVSSAAETLYALESPVPSRNALDLETIMRTPYEIDSLQNTYFVTPSLTALLHITLQDFDTLYTHLQHLPDHPQSQLIGR